MAKKPRTHVSELVMTLGPITVQGRLVPIQKPVESDVKHCSPEGNPVYQRYIDDEGNMFEVGELEKAVVDEDGNYRMIDKGELSEAKKSLLPKNEVTLTIHPAKDTQQWLYPSSKHNAYIFEPVIKDGKRWKTSSGNTKAYDLLALIVSSNKFEVVAQANIRGSEAVFKLILWKGYVAVQRQSFPEQLWDCYEPYVGTKIDAAGRKKALKVADKLAEKFDPDLYADQVAARVAEVKESDYVPGTIAAKNEEADEVSFEDILDMFE